MLNAIASAKAEIERRAADRRTKEQKTGKKTRGKYPKTPESIPRDKDQVNLTDKESRIMPISGGGFDQYYNAQGSVDVETTLITPQPEAQRQAGDQPCP